MAAKPKNGPMCIVSIGYQHPLMPAADGMKVVSLLAGAVDVDHDPDNYQRYVVNEPVRVRFETVPASHVRLKPEPASDPRRPLLLEGRRG
ncbi:hypothetical protein [Xanthomonas sp. CFBP 8445]|uniref:hypothetical protein n=1 Tax=Xanthomonas sp. CFBP 8445 TaxID=2971236 RepID=UPI0021DFEADD|nr:hypothetical protein [Xanthomonas sp. CFBP 8445]UYC12266.1 hypothetical protein NUG21_00480 [Xanthomonas sp. CFBP 8445]